MQPIIIVMLCVQVAMLLVAAYSIAFAKPRAPGARSVWISIGLPLVIVSAVSWQIADRRAGTEGADILEFGAALLLGMALAAISMLIRQRRGLDTVA